MSNTKTAGPAEPQKRLLAIGECMVEFAPDAATGLYRRGFAGDTFNTAWHFARLAPAGWQTAYFTRIGDDAQSEAMAAFMAGSGIDTAHVARQTGGDCGLYVISLADGERSFSYWRRNSAARNLADNPAALAQAISAADIIHFSGITLAILGREQRETLLAALSAAREDGRRIGFDPNIRMRLWPDADEMRAAITRAAQCATLILPSFDDEAAAFGDTTPEATIARYQAVGVQEVVVKNGAAGAVVGNDANVQNVASVPAAAPVDTTGAGDSFNAAYLAARAAGREPVAAARFANRVAGAVIASPGALVPVAATLQDFENT